MLAHTPPSTKDPIIPAKSTGDAALSGDESKSSGQPLPSAVRSDVEGKFGHNLKEPATP